MRILVYVDHGVRQLNPLPYAVLCQVPVPGAIASLQLTPQGVVHSMYPLKGNEAAMGHNVLKGQRRRVTQAYMTAS